MSNNDKAAVRLGNATVGDGQPVYVIGEIGLNHNGNIEVAKKLIDVASFAGCDAVKFQKRTPEISTPPEQRDVERDTPWGRMTYLEYRYRVEFGHDEYTEIDRYCREKNIAWFASPWDEEAVAFLESYETACYKVASAGLTDGRLRRALIDTQKPLIASTGMSSMNEIDAAMAELPRDRLLLMHTTSTYPCKAGEINLRMIETLKERYPGVPVGYSGHEVGLQITLAAVAMGACSVERHITLDRTMWGSDQAASVEPQGLIKLVRDIRIVEESFGDGEKRVYESELPIRKKLRRSVGAA